MFRIAVCDDDTAVCNQIETIFHKNHEIEGEKLMVEVFVTGTGLKQYLENESGYFDLIFLDIQMPGLDGIALGKYIREKKADYLTKIVFVSANEQYWKDFLEVEPMGFINKPIDETEILAMVHKALKVFRSAKKQFQFTNGSMAFRIDHSDILFFQKNYRKIHIFFQNEKKGGVREESFYGRMSDIMRVLEDQNFIMIHHSCIVNYRYIREYKYTSLSLVNGNQLEISQPKRKDVRSYMMKRIGEV